jgi:hypothetical protein
MFRVAQRLFPPTAYKCRSPSESSDTAYAYIYIYHVTLAVDNSDICLEEWMYLPQVISSDGADHALSCMFSMYFRPIRCFVMIYWSYPGCPIGRGKVQYNHLPRPAQVRECALLMKKDYIKWSSWTWFRPKLASSPLPSRDMCMMNAILSSSHLESHPIFCINTSILSCPWFPNISIAPYHIRWDSQDYFNLLSQRICFIKTY